MPNLALASTGITFPDSSVQTTAPSGFGFKNRIINGGFAIDQRNAGASQSVSLGYTLDRWLLGSNVAVTSQRVGSVGSYSWQITGASGNTGLTLIQRIESNNIGDLASQTVTFSFTASSSTLTSLPIYYSTPTAVDNYVSTNSAVLVGTATINASATRFSYTFTLPSTAINGIQIYFSTGALTSGTLTLSQIQLEKGSTATAFDYRPYGTELALCQRYYCNSLSGSGYSPLTTVAALNLTFPVTMRTVPTISITATLTITDGSANYTQSSANSGSYLGTSLGGLLASISNFTGLTANRPNSTNANGFNNPITASAEL